jgi:hypothetical protein
MTGVRRTITTMGTTMDVTFLFEGAGESDTDSEVMTPEVVFDVVVVVEVYFESMLELH